jgi:WD40 repeat protein
MSARRLAVVLGPLLAGAAAVVPALLWRSERSPVLSAVAPPAQRTPRAGFDLLGDPLPKGALARLGSRRLPPDAIGIAFLPDGKRVALAYRQGAVFVFDIRSGRELLSLGCQGGSGRKLACSPDGALLASFADEGPLYVWNVRRGKVRFRIPPSAEDGKGPRTLTFAPDKRSLVWHDGVNARLIDLATGKPRPALARLRKARAAVLAAEGRTLVVIDQTGELSLWDLRTGKRLRVLGKKWPNPQCLALSPDGKTLAAGGHQPAKGAGIALIDPATGRQRHWLKLPTTTTYYPVFSPDGKTLAAYTNRGGALLWDVQTGRQTAHYRGGSPDIGAYDIAYTPDGRAVGLFYSDRPRVIQTGEELCPLLGSPYPVIGTVITPDGRTAYTLSSDGRMFRWDLPTGKRCGEIAPDFGPASELVLSPDGGLLAATSRKCVRVYRRQGDDLRLSWSREETASCMAFSPDSKALVRVESALFLHDVATGRIVRQAPILAFYAAFSPDGRQLAVVNLGGVFRILDAVTLKERFQFRDSDWNHGKSLTFLPDGRSLLTADGDGTVRLWELASKQTRRRYCPRRRGLNVMCLAPDGQSIAVGRLWNSLGILSLTEPVSRWSNGLESTISSMTFDRSGRRLLTGSYDGTALLWDLRRVGLPPPAKAARLSDKQLDQRWRELSSTNAAKAYDALCDLLARPEQALTLFRASLRPVPVLPAGRLARLVRELDDDDFDTREQAGKQLEALGELARSELEKALKGKPSLELRNRARALLTRLDRAGLDGAFLRGIRAVEVLERIGTAPVRAVLAKVARGEPAARLTREAKESLDRLGRR